MSGNIQLNVSIGEQTKILLVPADCTIDHVFDEIKRKFIQTIEADQLEVIHAGMILSYGSMKTLVELEIKHASSLTVVMGLKGGQFKGPRPDGQYKTRVSFTNDKNDRCMITFDNDEMYPRAIMPCGHYITSEAMVMHCKNEVSKQKSQITCPFPGCSQAWDWATVEQVAEFKDDEKIQIQNSLSENFLMKSRGYFLCPGCKVWCTRTDKTTTIVRCANCSRDGRPYEFCSRCYTLSNGVKSICSNDSCDESIEKISILRKCPIKSIEDKFCPNKRACPGCTMLIEHLTKCKHVICYECKYEFCFICLNKWSDNSHLRVNCQLAPRQEDLSKKIYPSTNVNENMLGKSLMSNFSNVIFGRRV